MKDGKFESQKEIWDYLATGARVANNEGPQSGYYSLASDGNVYRSDAPRFITRNSFSDPSQYSPYEEPKKPRVAEAFDFDGAIVYAVPGSDMHKKYIQWAYVRCSGFDIVEKSE